MTKVFLDVTTGKGRTSHVVGRVEARTKMWTNRGSVTRITPAGTVFTTEGQFRGGRGLRVTKSQAERHYGYELAVNGRYVQQAKKARVAV